MPIHHSSADIDFEQHRHENKLVGCQNHLSLKPEVI